MSNATRTLRHRYATTTVDGYFTLADQTFGECRQRVISYLVKLNRALNADLPDLSQALLSRFCDALVDYLSEGHFRVFQRLSLPAQSYALIDATTQAGMAFNDRFGDRREVRPGAGCTSALRPLRAGRRAALRRTVLNGAP
jgi:regulator of sigma D